MYKVTQKDRYSQVLKIQNGKSTKICLETGLNFFEPLVNSLNKDYVQI